jgi:hypothetical protein
MVFLLRLLAVCGLLFAPVLAKRFVWTGGDMSFNNALNWEEGAAPNDTNTPCSTTMGAPGAVIISNLGVSAAYSRFVLCSLGCSFF